MILIYQKRTYIIFVMIIFVLMYIIIETRPKDQWNMVSMGGITAKNSLSSLKACVKDAHNFLKKFDWAEQEVYFCLKNCRKNLNYKDCELSLLRTYIKGVPITKNDYDEAYNRQKYRGF